MSARDRAVEVGVAITARIDDPYAGEVVRTFLDALLADPSLLVDLAVETKAVYLAGFMCGLTGAVEDEETCESHTECVLMPVYFRSDK